MSQRLFVDGASGTVGLAVMPHLMKLLEEELLSEVVVLSEDARKDTDARMAAMAEADIVLLCLPDDVALAAARMAKEVNPAVRLLDASAAHRCQPDWEYGLPELHPRMAQRIRSAQQVANPGCFATGCILLAKPLSTRYPLLLPHADGGLPWMAFQGITGYSAAGSRGQPADTMPYLAQLGRPHRHLAEIARYAHVTPMLTTMVGSWRQGMLVQAMVPLRAPDVYVAYIEAYGRCSDIDLRLAPQGGDKLSALVANGTNQVHLVVAPCGDGTLVAAAFDNLGKGSAGAAAHNLRLMLS
ncbi:hypothetical protein [Burkholderia ambifaria]|uniref:hypothetical protein n=1 Tax=Burkholderia ambifaria TaxID=152480 RepID=UPI000F80A782|nr:hypothetical protein [Burkholderia ambifaria]